MKKYIKHFQDKGIDVYNLSLVDERLVESHHPDSNAGVIKNYFLQNSAKVANFTPFFKIYICNFSKLKTH